MKYYMKKVVAPVTLCVLLAVSLMGCGSSNSAKGAAQYVQGVLDITYQKGTDAYVKAAGADKADALKYSEQAAKAQAQVMAAYFGIEEPSDEVLETFESCYVSLCEKCSYEVKDEGDKVEIQVTGVKIGGSEEIADYIDDFNVKEFVDGDESCTDEAFAKEVSELILAEQDDSSQADVTVEITVTENNGEYAVSDEDLAKVDAAVLQYQ